MNVGDNVVVSFYHSGEKAGETNGVITSIKKNVKVTVRYTDSLGNVERAYNVLTGHEILPNMVRFNPANSTYTKIEFSDRLAIKETPYNFRLNDVVKVTEFQNGKELRSIKGLVVSVGANMVKVTYSEPYLQDKHVTRQFDKFTGKWFLNRTTKGREVVDFEITPFVEEETEVKPTPLLEVFSVKDVPNLPNNGVDYSYAIFVSPLITPEILAEIESAVKKQKMTATELDGKIVVLVQ